MLKYLTSFHTTQKLISRLGALYVIIVYKTSSKKLKNRKKIEMLLSKKNSFIYAFWHDQLLMCPLSWQSDSAIKVLISKHRDGDIVAGLISHLGFDAIRGSTHREGKKRDKGGLLSARKMIKSLKSGINIGISPDGPKGPRHKVSDGIVDIPRLSKAPILPVALKKKKKWVLKTWDKFIIPKPFNEIKIIWGDPMPSLKNKKNKNLFREKLEKEMNKLTIRANK